MRIGRILFSIAVFTPGEWAEDSESNVKNS